MEQGYELKPTDIRKAVLEQSQNNELYIPLHGKYTTNLEEEPFDLAEKIRSFFAFDDASQHDPKVMLLMGDTGSGKSVFSQQLTQQLWRAYKAGDPIPLWIPLPELENPFESAVEEVLRKYGFDDGKIAEIKAQERFIFIVDGYDELHQFQNCYVTNNWEKWNAKVLITCRSQALYYQKDPDKYFMPFNGEKSLPILLRKLYVAAFSKEQISAYVKQYQQLNSENNISEEDFSKVPGLAELINTPFLLHLAVEALPDILATQVNDQKMTQAKLYDVFIERWFTRQVKKLSIAGLIKDTEQKTKQQFWDYCKNLAQKMHEKEVSVIPYQGSKVGGRLFGKQERVNIWESFFNEDSEILRSACPLKRFGEHHYGFVHASMVEYFATRAMYEEITQDVDTPVESKEQVNYHPDEGRSSVLFKLGLDSGLRPNDNNMEVHNDEAELLRKNDQPRGGIHRRVFALERQSIQFLADRIQMNEKFKQKMLSVLEASKKNIQYAIGAANAITSLIRASVTFNGADLSGINIEGADISGGYFDNANFESANLNQVHLSRAWLRQANMHNCQMIDINFGEYPWFKHDVMYGGVRSLSYLPHQNRLVTASAYKIIVWNIETGECLKEFEDNTSVINRVSLNESGEIITYVSRNNGLNRVCEWDVSTESIKSIREQSGKVIIDGLYVAENYGGFYQCIDGRTIIEVDGGTEFKIKDVVSGNKKILSGHQNWVTCAYGNQDGKIIASGSMDDTIRVWDVESGHSVVMRGHEDHVTCIYLSSDGKRVVSGSDDKTVRFWDVPHRQELVSRGGHEDSISCVRISADGGTIVSGSDSPYCKDYTVRLWDVKTGNSIVMEGHTGSIQSVDISMDGKTVISSSKDNTVRVWDVINGRSEVLDIECHVNCVSLSANGKIVLLGCDDKKIRLINLLSGHSLVFEGHESCVSSIHFSSDGKNIVSGSHDRTVRIWNIATLEAEIFEENQDVEDEGQVNSIFLSSDGKSVLSGCGSHYALTTSLRMRNLTSGQSKMFRGHNKAVTSVHLCKDARTLISSSWDRTVRCWDVQSQTQKAILHFSSAVLSISMHDDLGLLTIGLHDSSLQLWQRMDDLGCFWQMRWSSKSPNPSLMLWNCNVINAHGLSSKNQQLLKQRNAVTEPIPKLHQLTYSSENLLEPTKHKIVGQYCVMKRFNQQESEELFQKEGIKLIFKSSEVDKKVILGHGNFGKIEIARHLLKHHFLCVKKIHGEENIKKSMDNIELQRKLNGLPNIMPLLDTQTMKSKKYRNDILLQFMPLAAFGNGDLLLKLLHLIDNNDLKQKIIIHVLKSLLIGVDGMHRNGVCHLDIKPENFVLDRNGIVYIIDFGCAQPIYEYNKLLSGGEGDFRYFSPDRLAVLRKRFCQQLFTSNEYEVSNLYDACKADMWAVGITFLQYYMGNNNFISGWNEAINWKLKHWNSKHFQQCFERIPGWLDAPERSILGVLKSLLQTSCELRPTASDILKNPLFLDSIFQISTADLKINMEKLMMWNNDSPRNEKDIKQFNI